MFLGIHIRRVGEWEEGKKDGNWREGGREREGRP